MNKPLSLVVQETEEKIVEEINKPRLPIYVLKTILERLYKQVEILEQEEIKKYYEEELKKGEKKEDDK